MRQFTHPFLDVSPDSTTFTLTIGNFTSSFAVMAAAHHHRAHLFWPLAVRMDRAFSKRFASAFSEICDAAL